MPYLLGAFGARCIPEYIKKLAHIAAQKTAHNTQQTILLEHGIIFAGNKHDETYEYDHITPLPENSGMLVGKVFDRANYTPVNFTHELAHTCVNNPQQITKLFWGRYVGALFNKTIKTLTLVRDPQGLSTIFYHATPDGVVFYTELSLLYEALENKPAIDLTFFGQHLIHANQALAATPFEGIKELLPGMGLSFNLTGNYSQKLLWDVSQLGGSLITDENAFEEELLATLRSCTKAWVGNAPGVCVELSGGTDSSGVLLLLHDVLPDKKLVAVNYIDSKTQSSNEIEFAQETADACNVQLHFLDWQTTSLLDKLPADFLPNRPSTLLMSYKLHKQLHDFALENNCPEIMNGQGGDHIFCAPPPDQALADYWFQRGISGITKPLKELSGIYRTPWFSLIRKNTKAAVCYYRKTRYIDLQHRKTTHLNKDFLQQLKEEDFYLNSVLSRMHPGKAAQIESLCHAVSYSERNQTTSNICHTHPILSQPIIELGLRIPTYQSFYDGYDRIFFRRAVSRIRKTKSLWRRIKGQTTGTMIKQCAHHANDIRDIICNGQLVKSGLIDKQWLDTELIKMQHSQVESLWPILHMLTGQLWLNQWRL